MGCEGTKTRKLPSQQNVFGSGSSPPPFSPHTPDTAQLRARSWRHSPGASRFAAEVETFRVNHREFCLQSQGTVGNHTPGRSAFALIRGSAVRENSQSALLLSLEKLSFVRQDDPSSTPTLVVNMASKTVERQAARASEKKQEAPIVGETPDTKRLC